MKEDITDEQAMKIGVELKKLLGLKQMDSLPRYKTSWGTKTLIGLGHSVYRICFEVTQYGKLK